MSPPGRRPPKGPRPPRPKGRGRPGKKKKKVKNFGGYKVQEANEFETHAKEIKALTKGKDYVDLSGQRHEQRPAPFDRKQLQVVRSWLKSRPLEPMSPASALVPYPRMWNTKRGRYTRFKIPGAGTYGILRSRPSF